MGCGRLMVKLVGGQIGRMCLVGGWPQNRWEMGG